MLSIKIEKAERSREIYEGIQRLRCEMNRIENRATLAEAGTRNDGHCDRPPSDESGVEVYILVPMHAYDEWRLVIKGEFR